jgi:nucleoside-diphosphate-sugar epimerase
LIPAIVERLKKGLSVIELATLNGCRNYLFITDAVSALMKLINNIGIESDICVSGENVRIEKIVELFQKTQKEKVGSTVQFIAKSSKSPRASFKSPPDTMDDSIFREKYDWSPKVSMHQGILLTMELES